jgi:hypothetical protein
MSPDAEPPSRPTLPSFQRQLVSFLFALLLVAPLAILFREFAVKKEALPSVQVRRIDYHGWTNSLVLENATAEVVVVPAIGRVMRFGFRGEEGPFWENASLHGQAPDPASTNWGNFGGDKTWPSPEADWNARTPRAWPPPVAFDSMPVEAETRSDRVRLRSAVDPHYGIRVERDIRLDSGIARMTIVTTYEQASVPTPPVADAATNRVGIWIITQLAHPVRVWMPVPVPSLFPDGYRRISGATPAPVYTNAGLLSLTRDPAGSHKIGNDAGTLVWVGEKTTLRIDSPRVPGADYPDQGCSAEVYTNPDPASYVELEMLGPLSALRVGDRISQTNVYTLHHRQETDVEQEALRVLR